MSQPEWQDLQHSGIFEYVSPAWFDENNLTGSSQPTRVSLLIVAPNYLALLGVKPQLGRVFDPYFAVNRRALAWTDRGLGLGLAISRRYADGMAGALHVASDVGSGSTFTLTLLRA